MQKYMTMKTAGALALALGLTLGSLTAADGKWVELFNGKDLTGWTGMNGVAAAVVEGNLQIAKGMGWLRFEKEYKDFILELEWRAYDENYDSGIYLRSGL